ncbi:MAG: glutamate racemase [Lachnospiraceae bacterium]|nr:glutamate racemase [Lachnospiraceae bacterium]
MDTRPVGVFDSGIGGLTSVKELTKILPNEDIVYFGDTARVPYGSHSSETIIEFAKQDLQFMLSKNVKAILIACGTVSSTSISVLRSICDIPVIGVITGAAKKAAVIGGKVVVLATQATIASHAFKENINALNSQCVVYEKACPLFVPLIENGYTSRNNIVVKTIVSDYLSGFQQYNPDSIILGCTHYPLLIDAIRELFPASTIIEAGKEAASEIKDVLVKEELEAPRNQVGKRKYYVSETTETFKSVCEMFLGEQIDEEISLVYLS